MHNFLPLESKLQEEGFFSIAGIDEAGRGPLAGPVVSAIVILKKDTKIKGLNDSKKLSEKQRNILFPQVLQASLDYAIGIVPPQIIDEVNILNATRIANDICLRSLKSKPDLVLIDGKDKQIFKKQEFITIIKGDSKIQSIAAASILAKVTRDHIMKRYAKQYPEYGFEKHMGYGTKLHRQALSKYGRSEIHRKSFSYKKVQ